MSVLKKISEIIFLFFGITLISFFVVHLAPGNVVDVKQNLAIQMSQEARAKLEKLYGLDKPVLLQYQEWLWRIVRFDFGNSFFDGEKVSVKIMRAAPVTIGIQLLSLALIFGIGVWLGVISAVYKNHFFERAATFLSLGALSLPGFWLGLIFISYFGVHLRILPVSGLHSLFYEKMTFVEKILDLARHLLLPVLIFSLSGIGSVSRYTKSSMLEVLKQNYIRSAWAKGLSKNEVLYKHALKNALLPVITLVGLSVPSLLGGSVVLESIFSISGMGRLFYTAIFTRDYPVIMGILVLGAVLTLLGNLLADLAYRQADPRIRTSA